MTLSKSELSELKRAKVLLENPGLAARLSAMLGSPLEKGMAMLPTRFQTTVHKASEAAMMKALDVAVKSLDGGSVGRLSRDRAQERGREHFAYRHASCLFDGVCTWWPIEE
jgi:hypothetical protein